MSATKVIYEGVDIYPDVSMGRCFDDMRGWGGMDALTVDFGDTRNLWVGWNPAEGDTIRIADGAADTGDMIVSTVKPQSSRITIRAYPAPQSARVRRCQSWERVRLFQLLGDVAGRNGLSYETYGLDNYEYDYVEQDNETDLAFLDRRLTYEGAALVVYDGKLVAYSGTWLESQDTSDQMVVTPGVDYEFVDDSARAYGSCTVTDGSYTATYDDHDGKNLLKVISDRISSQAEAERFAKGLLRAANREETRMVIETDSMLRGYAPGTVVDLDATAARAWGGKAIVYRMRQDYYDARCKIWLARPLGSY